MIVTRDDVLRHPQGQPLSLPAGALLTSAARDEAKRRGVEIRFETRGADDAGCGCGTHPCSCARAPAPPPPSGAPRASSAPSDWETRLPGRRLDASLWRGSSGPSKEDSPSAPVPREREVERATLGAPEPHLDACAFRTGGECRDDVVVVTAVGRNRPRVLAELATGIADLGGDIQEISQRIVDGLFHTLLTVDMSRSKLPFPKAKDALEGLSREGDYTVRVQHERVFRYMHRI